MIKYIERAHAYYGAQGYASYQWAKNETTPFTSLPQPLADSTLVLISTAAPYREELGDQGPGAAYNAAAKFYDVFSSPVDPRPDLRISHIGYDRKHCAAEDSRCWLPIDALQNAATDGRIGAFAPELIGVPTNRSQRSTSERDAPQALAHAQRLGADAALLVPT